MELETILYRLQLEPEDHLLRMYLIKNYMSSEEYDIALNHIEQGLKRSSDLQVRL